VSGPNSMREYSPARPMMFVRTLLGIVVVACIVALVGLGYRLWEVQRQLAIRVKALEQQAASTEAKLAEMRAWQDRHFDATEPEEQLPSADAPQGL